MANRNFPSQRIFGFHLLPVSIDGSVAIGGTGAVGTVYGPGIASVTRLAVGIYRIRLQDSYAKFLAADFKFQAPVSGSNVAATALTPGLMYQITVMGTSTQANWVTAGVPSDITAAVGVVFLAAATSSGTGQAKILGFSGISSVEILGSPDLMQPPINVPNLGEYITIKCIGPTSSSVTTPIAVDPADGSTLFFRFLLNNSQIQ